MLDQCLFVGKLTEINERREMTIQVEEVDIRVFVPDERYQKVVSVLSVGNLIAVKGHVGHGNAIICDRITMLTRISGNA